MNKEMLVDSITSSKIDWKEGKNSIEKKVIKNCKNKSMRFNFIFLEL